MQIGLISYSFYWWMAGIAVTHYSGRVVRSSLCDYTDQSHSLRAAPQAKPSEHTGVPGDTQG